MSAHFTAVAEKTVLQRRSVLNRINHIWGELEKLRGEVSESMPEAASIIESLDYGCTHLMNCSIDVEASLYENLPEQNRIEEATLDQLLSVLTTIRSCSPRSVEETRRARIFGSSLVAKSREKEQNTISDLWVRRLNLSGQTREFDELVFEWLTKKADRLCQVIKAHVDEAFHAKIDEVFRSFES